jgi:hypothetical protein
MQGAPASTLALPKLWRFTITSKERWTLNDHPDVLDDLTSPQQSRPSAFTYYDFTEKEWLTTPVTDTIPLHGLQRALIRPKDLEDHECTDLTKLIEWLTTKPLDPVTPDSNDCMDGIQTTNLPPKARVRGKSKAQSPEPKDRPIKRRKTEPPPYTVNLDSSSDNLNSASDVEEMGTVDSLSWWMRLKVRDAIRGLERMDQIRRKRGETHGLDRFEAFKKVFRGQEWVEATWKRQRSALKSLTEKERKEWLLEKGDLLWLELHKYVVTKQKKEEQKKKETHRKGKGKVKVKLEPVECITISDDDDDDNVKTSPSEVEPLLPPPPKSEPTSPHLHDIELQTPQRMTAVKPKEKMRITPSSKSAPTSSPAKFADFFENPASQHTSQDHSSPSPEMPEPDGAGEVAVKKDLRTRMSEMAIVQDLAKQILEYGICCFCNEHLPSPPSLDLRLSLYDALRQSTAIPSPQAHPFARKFVFYDEDGFCESHCQEVEMQQKVERREKLEESGRACPINQCYDPSPSNPSPRLKRYLESYEEARLSNAYNAFELETQICRRHRGEAKFEDAVASGWPVIISPAQLEARLDSHRPSLTAFLSNPHGTFWDQFSADIRAGVFRGNWGGLLLKAEEYPVG